MNKRFLSFLLSLFLFLFLSPVKAHAEPELYDIWIGGIQADSENASDLVTAINNAYPGSASGMASYDQENHTLTIENFNLVNRSTGSGNIDYYGIDYQGDTELTIIVNGENSILSRDRYNNDTTAVNVARGLNLKGTGKLTVTGGYAGGDYGDSIGIDTYITTIDGPELIVTGGTSAGGYSYGMDGDLHLITGQVTVNGGTAQDDYSYGIDGEATVDGGTLIVNGGDSNYYSYGIYSGLTLNDGTVKISIGRNVDPNRSYSVYGISSLTTVNGGSLEISGGSSAGDDVVGISGRLTVTGGRVEISTGEADDDSICVGGELRVGVEGGESDAEVILRPGTGSYSSMGVYSTVYIYNGTLDILSGDSPGRSYGISGTLYDRGGTARIESGNAPVSYAVNGTPNISGGVLELIAGGDGTGTSQISSSSVYIYSDSVSDVETVSPNPDGSDPVPYVRDNYAQYRYLKTGPAYRLWVDGRRVTGKNASDVFGDGKVSLDEETKTLKLNNVSIGDTAEYAGIHYEDSSFGALTIEFSGSNTIYSDEHGLRGGIYSSCYDAEYNYYPLTIRLTEGAALDITASTQDIGNDANIYGIRTYGDLIIDGDGTVNVRAADLTGNILGTTTGIYVKDLTLSGKTVVNTYGGNCDAVVFGDRADDSYGVRLTGDLVVEDSAILNAYGGSTITTPNTGYMTVSAGLVMDPEHRITMKGSGKALVKGGICTGDDYRGSFGFFCNGWSSSNIHFVSEDWKGEFDIRGESGHSAMRYIYGTFSFNIDPDKTEMTVYTNQSDETGTDIEGSTYSVYGRSVTDQRLLLYPKIIHHISITAGEGMTPSGTYEEDVVNKEAMTSQVYTATEGYYFPEDYSMESLSGISVTRDSYIQITVSGTPTDSVTMILKNASLKQKEATPGAVFTAKGSDSGTLTNIEEGMIYSIDDGTAVTVTSTSLDLTGLSPCTIKVVKPGNGTTTIDSDPQVITVKKAETPSLTAVQPKAADEKGSIPTETIHEISTDGVNWTVCAGESKDLDPGTYYVRISASGSVLASDIQTIVIEEYKPEGVAVIRLSGKLRYDTSLKIADELKSVLGVDKFDTVILATGENFADALGGGYLAAKKGAPILLTKSSQKDKINKYINENLKENGTVYVLGGTGAVSEECLEGLNTSNIKRLSGRNRYLTNLAILEEAGVTNEDILIATGISSADSLSASATGLPMLLVNGKNASLNDQQRAFLTEHSSNTFYILGGNGAVSEAIEADIASINKVSRIKGSSRYETTIEIAKTFDPSAEKAVLAAARDTEFPDGLCAGPLAYALKAPILLTNDGKESQAAAYASSHSIYSGYICGGGARISDDTARTIFSLDPSAVIGTRD